MALGRSGGIGLWFLHLYDHHIGGGAQRQSARSGIRPGCFGRSDVAFQGTIYAGSFGFYPRDGF